ncbi:MAG: hypothetical protein UV54_C0002G0036 [Candidatus Beckwithbacteria bacterium GW2011_GWA2_43_10]|uniref:DUF5678 domain-containing protein n=1 Tax=Candidatus Beckwithbacteria bacterium GW2011_GWA2_43_10 TaxID=1618369 RepID=A0A0G1C5E6_9BACT|nr:MAG: hypothetical protein UV54_C0002G0036 [Candidatus Beckwithbacteria bacterium GW2011_GWA2_43_10]
MKVKNWTHLLPKFAGQWVAFDKDEGHCYLKYRRNFCL